MNSVRSTVFLLIISLFCSGCYLSKKLENVSLDIYEASEYEILPIIALNKEGVQELIIKLPADTFVVEVKGFESFQASSLFYTFNEPEEIVYRSRPYFRLPIPEKNFDYQLMVSITGRHTPIRYKDLVKVEYSVARIDPHIHLLDENGWPYSLGYIPVNESLTLDCETAKDRKISIEYYSDRSVPALPPFSAHAKPFKFLAEPDDETTVSCGTQYTFKEAGIYRVVADNSRYRLICCVPPDFPKVTNVDELTLSLRYITKNEEYQAIRQAANPKQELDAFWLKRTSSVERSRNLISIYYNRIQEANRYFTDFKHGWKTDRGMIFTIFGVPDKIEKAPLFEYWYYEPTTYREEAAFFFDHTLKGELILRRSEYLERTWNSQVLMWRQGITE